MGAGQTKVGGPPMSGFSRELWTPRSELTSLGTSAIELVPLLVGHSVEEIERELVLHTLRHYEGNRMHSARILGISVRGLRNKINQYAGLGIVVPESKQSRRILELNS
jgi:DNA-binding NtrC family response regulator